MTMTAFSAYIALVWNGYAFEHGVSRSGVTVQPPANNSGVIVLDNDLLERYFGRKPAEEGEKRGDAQSSFSPAASAGGEPPVVLPYFSLLPGITAATPAREAAAIRLAEQGRIFLAEKEYQKAVYYLEKALTLAPSAVVQFYLAQAHYDLGDHQKCLSFLEIAAPELEQQPQWSDEVRALRTAASAPRSAVQSMNEANGGLRASD